MDREGCRETVQHLESVAVEHAHMMVPGLDDQEQVQRIGGEDRARSGGIVRVPGQAGRDLLGTPRGHLGDRRLEIGGEFRARIGIQRIGEARHLRRRPALGDHAVQRRSAQAPQGLRDQGRAGAAQPVGAMAGGTVLRIEHRRVGQRGARDRDREASGNYEPDHGSFP